MRNSSILGMLAMALGFSAAGRVMVVDNAAAQAIDRVPTGNEKGSRRTAKFSSHKPGSMKQFASMKGVITAKELAKRIHNARDYNKGLDTETRYMKATGKAFTRVIPNPGTLNLGMNRH